MSLDQILIQLKEVAPHWRRLGEAVGVGRLDEISQYVCQTWESSMPLAYCVSLSRWEVRVMQWWRWWMGG